MKGLFSQIVTLLVILVVGTVQLQAQCSGPMTVSIQGSGSGMTLSASQTHVDAHCPGDNGTVTISGLGGTAPYIGTGTFFQPVGTQSYTVVDMLGCMSSVSVTIIAMQTRPTGSISGTGATICSGQSTPLTLTVVGTGTISGTLSDGTPFTGIAPTITVNVSPLMTTTYTIATLSDNFCSSTPAELSGSATVMVIPCANISGKLIWEGNRLTLMTGVNLGTVTLSGDDNDVDITGIPGTYALTYTTGHNFMVTPTKNRPMPFALNGVTAADASRILKHVNGTLPFNDPYKVIAADVDKSNSVTNADATLVQQAVLGYPEPQKLFTQTTWRFIPKSYSFPIPNNPWSPAPFPEKINIVGLVGSLPGQDFIGVKLGDVNSSANPANFSGGLAPALVLKVPEQTLTQDSPLEIEFRAVHFNALIALQFGLQFDPSKLELTGFETLSGSPFQESDFGFHSQEFGEIRSMIAFSDPKTLADDTPVFRLKFKSLQAGTKLSEALFLSDAVLPAIPYGSDFTPGTVNLVFESTLSGTNELENSNYRLLQNRPNPFKEMTTIGFILPNACEAQIRVFNFDGRLITTQKGWFESGYNEQEIRLDKNSVNGVLYYELVTPFGILSKKMAVSEN